MTPDVQKAAKRFVSRQNIARLDALPGHKHWIKFAERLAAVCDGSLPEMRDIAGLRLYKLFNAMFDHGKDFAHIKQMQPTPVSLPKSKLPKLGKSKYKHSKERPWPRSPRVVAAVAMIKAGNKEDRIRQIRKRMSASLRAP
jgi:hypothetical protein